LVLLLNFGHPLGQDNREKIIQICDDEIEEKYISSQHDQTKPVLEVARELVNAAGLSARDWKNASIVLIPPGLPQIAMAILAEIHGRHGGFPKIVNIRPTQTKPTRYDVAEIVDLQKLRNEARTQS
jgi:hypothetical protein